MKLDVAPPREDRLQDILSAEAAVELADEGERVVRQDLGEAVVLRRGDVQCHGRLPLIEWSRSVIG